MEARLIFTSHPALVRFNGMTLDQIRTELVSVQLSMTNRATARILGILPAATVDKTGGSPCAR